MLTLSPVLVPVLHRLLLGYDHLKSLHWSLPPPGDGQTSAHVDHLRCHGYYSLDGRRFLLRYHVPVHAHQFLLEPVWIESAQERLLCAN